MEAASGPRAERHKRGVWTTTELRCLATALGYPRDLLVDCIPSDVRKERGMNSEALRKILDLGHFTLALNLTWNMKSGHYNVAVIKKCIQLLDSGIVSFNEIRNVRIAFSTYEQLYQNGLTIDQHTLMRALKMCSRVVAPQKLMHRIKHWKSTYTVKERIQLYEFMDLLLLSEPVDKVFIKEKVRATEKAPRDLSKFEDIESLGQTHEERLARHLDKQFYKEERDYGTVTTDSQLLIEHPLIRYRKQAAELHRKEYQWLKTTLEACHVQRKQVKGRRLMLPLPALDECQETCSEWAQGSSSASKSRACTAKGWSATPQQEEEDMDEWVWVVSVPPLKSGTYIARSLPPILSAEELEAVQKKKEEIQYRMKSAEERAVRELNWKMDYHLPGYRKLSASKQNADGPMMKTTSLVEPNLLEMLSFPVKSCCRSRFHSQAAKCHLAKLEKPASAPRLKDSKHRLSLKAQGKKGEKIQQPLHGQNDSDQGRTADRRGLLRGSCSTSKGVSSPVINIRETSIRQPPVIMLGSELTEGIAEQKTREVLSSPSHSEDLSISETSSFLKD
ncbi:uncharacterized protein [Heptranchias perlo]|uniref:uncharacterized protein isoform X2 n=1 Tax=Heptranchias perlo TaxID=212740 RepID=UPI00355A2FAE